MRVALWRALHVQVDPPPHVLEDEIGLRLVGPGRRLAPPSGHGPAGTTRLFRASIVARARFIEDLVVEQAGRGVGQYVILGAGLDTFAQRRPEIASRLRVFEVDQPGPQAWKRQRLIELGFGVPEWLRLVPVDFEAGDSWWDGWRPPASMPASRRSWPPPASACTSPRTRIAATLRQVAALAPGSTLAMTFLLPLELVDEEVRPGLQLAEKGARATGTPFLSFFTPAEMLALAREAGFREARHVSLSRTRPALLRRPDRWLPAVERGGSPGGNHLKLSAGVPDALIARRGFDLR